ncbi:hypothetical protein [Paenibacillus thalictri]|uniref:ParA family protein n=1 Tax=Paenibacillus thalictri TaxID=2527873 RepID=A0A4Q9DX49_9BACL|nr:hypothetical protein [Paenibacillus thalictri]TBL80610.1 hypothetical protein EYB31_05110 [Paenibacillus thalictri]
MKVWLIANDPRIGEMLEHSGLFAAVLHAVPGQPLSPDQGDCVVVSDKLLNSHEVVDLKACAPAAEIVYLLSNRDDHQELKRLQSLCAAHGVKFVPPKLTAEQVAGEIAMLCAGSDQRASRVIAGIGALPQIGLTSSLLLLGVKLGGMTGARIGILGLNGWNPGDAGLSYEGKYVDDIWGALQGRQLRPEELLRGMHHLTSSVYYLAGNRDLKKLYYYQPEGVSWLIQTAKQLFDVVLIDAGAYLDHALAAQSVYESDLLLVQLNQSQQAGDQWRRQRDQILRPVFANAEDKCVLLFNKMHEGPDVETAKQLSRQQGMPYIASLPYIPGFSRGEAERKLLERVHPGFGGELEKACRAVMQFYELPQAEPELRADKKKEAASWLRLSRWSRAERGVAAK